MKRNCVVRIDLILSLLFIIIALGACAGSQMNTPAESMENPVQEVQVLGEEIAKARIDQINVLSPNWFNKAEEAYIKAKVGLEKGDELSSILKNVDAANGHLEKANEMATISKTTLAGAIKGREMARNAGAANLGDDYARVEKSFLRLTEAIEKNNLDYAQKNRQKVTDEFHQLEIRAIKTETIGEVRKLMQQAKAQKADKSAPASYAYAERKLREADEFITQNPYEKEVMKKKADEALFSARRLISIAEQSEKIKTMAPEKIALWIEDTLHKTTTQLSAQDMRDQKFEVQLDNIIGSISSLQKDHRFMMEKAKSQETQIDGLYKRIALLEAQSREEQAQKARLAQEKRFNELFTKVQGYFNKGEADVYKQKDQLVIRLKAMQFPVGQNVIMPENYALLSKVQRAIRTFGEPHVVIEGHTDSTGSEEVNDYLSQQRADAVRKYLIANQTLPSKNMVAVGYGSEKPLASNATAEGRAINRRIDVVIKPLNK